MISTKQPLSASHSTTEMICNVGSLPVKIGVSEFSHVPPPNISIAVGSAWQPLAQTVGAEISAIRQAGKFASWHDPPQLVVAASRQPALLEEEALDAPDPDPPPLPVLPVLPPLPALPLLPELASLSELPEPEPPEPALAEDSLLEEQIGNGHKLIIK